MSYKNMKYPVFIKSANTDVIFAVFVALFFLFLSSDVALCQPASRNPFGLSESSSGGPPPIGLVAWLLVKQIEFNKAMISALRATRDGGEAWALLSVAFLYGVFHAAGPGHGKAVVSSYVFANGQTVLRGVAIAVAAAVLQALVAITLVVPAVLLFGATAKQINASVAWIEIACFSAIFILGLSLTFRKYRAFRASLVSSSVHIHHKECCHGLHAEGHDHAHQHGLHCSHVHLPDARSLDGRRSWRELVAVTLAAGSRPCSGALILLAFSLSVDALTTGILSVFAMATGTAITTSAFAIGALAAKKLTTSIADKSEKLRPLVVGLELVAALLVTILGAALLQGYISIG